MRPPGFAVFAICGLLSLSPLELKSGLDLNSLDRSIRPQDDLYLFANGGWLRQSHIPADRVAYGTFVELTERAESNLREIIENLQGRTPVERQVRDLYASVMDEARLEELGVRPLAPQLDRIEAATGASGIADAAGRLSAAAAGGPFGASMGLDPDHPDQIVVRVTQGGTLLPDREYYLKQDAASVAIRTAYVGYLETLFRLTHRADPVHEAQDVLRLETELATAQRPQVDSRGPTPADQVFTLRRMSQQLPGFDWSAWAMPQGIDRATSIVLGQPEFFRTFAELSRTRPLATWKAWLAARYITAAAPFLCKSISDARFEFFGRTLTGQQTPRVRWKQGVALVSQLMGDALGRMYVEKHFPREARDRVERLAAHMLAAYRQAVNETDWMTPQTREHALRKLSRLRTRIGQPDHWRSYTGLEIRREGLLGNTERAQKFESEYRLARLLGDRERDEWAMTPQTVNAWYLPWRNEMILPAAILQPPLFDADADDAVNYGGIGAIIGHEMQHAFDRLGRQIDAAGAARDWWSAKDSEAFERREQILVDQFNRYSETPGVQINGQATVGENAADLGGLSIAARAYELSLAGKPAPEIDGFTGPQRLLIRWAQVWRSQTREEYLRETLLINLHAPSRARANGAVTNLDAFYRAFAVQPGDALFLPPDRRVRIWDNP